jgi:hypothetical protein
LPAESDSALIRAGDALATNIDMEERRKTRERRQLSRAGRRTSDPRPEQCICIETRQEVGRLRAVMQILVDAVQALTVAHNKPQALPDPADPPA